MGKAVCTTIVLVVLFIPILAYSDSGTTADIPITGSEKPVTLNDLLGTSTLITVVLKDSQARDTNLTLSEVCPDRIIVMTSKGEPIPYLADSIERIEIQGGEIMPRRAVQMDIQLLRPEHQRVVERAWARIRDIFENTNDDQHLKILAATLLTLSNEGKAHDYLRKLAEANDLEVQLTAAGCLFLVGDAVSEALIRQGLDSGNRRARIKAAGLAGLTGYKDVIPVLQNMFKDRAVELSTPAGRALARLQDRSAIPRLMEMIFELHAEKGETAVFGLTRLADSGVIQEIKDKIVETEGMVRFRLVRVLYNLDDPEGITELRSIFKRYPTLAPEVALLLAQKEDWEATQFLRSRLARREDPTQENQIYRSRNAQALLQGGDPSALAVFQELLRSDNEEVTKQVFKSAVEVGQPRFLTLLQPAIENVDKKFALNAATAVIALALPDFRNRLLAYREEFRE